MGLAFSGSDIVRIEAIDGSTAASLMAGIHTALTAAGWLSSAMTGGNKYRIESPQGLYARCRITDTTNIFGQRVSVQFTSDDEAREGYIHHLGCASGRVFQIWANICQFFLSRPDMSDESGYPVGSVCGGVPWVANPPGGAGVNERPNDCEEGLPDEPETDVWWSCGDAAETNPFYRPNFRTGYRTLTSWSACYKSDLMLHEDRVEIAYRSLRLVPVTEMYNVDYEVAVNPEIRWIADGKPLLLDPLLAWALDAAPDQRARTRAEVWDACLVSMDFDLDSERDLDGLTYINYTHSTDRAHGRGSFFCTLHLLKARPLEPPPVAANYAY